MKAARFHRPGDPLRVEEVPDPELVPGAAIVRVLSAFVPPYFAEMIDGRRQLSPSASALHTRHGHHRRGPGSGGRDLRCWPSAYRVFCRPLLQHRATSVGRAESCYVGAASASREASQRILARWRDGSFAHDRSCSRRIASSPLGSASSIDPALLVRLGWFEHLATGPCSVRRSGRVTPWWSMPPHGLVEQRRRAPQCWRWARVFRWWHAEDAGACSHELVRVDPCNRVVAVSPLGTGGGQGGDSAGGGRGGHPCLGWRSATSAIPPRPRTPFTRSVPTAPPCSSAAAWGICPSTTSGHARFNQITMLGSSWYPREGTADHARRMIRIRGAGRRRSRSAEVLAGRGERGGAVGGTEAPAG